MNDFFDSHIVKCIKKKLYQSYLTNITFKNFDDDDTHSYVSGFCQLFGKSCYLVVGGPYVSYLEGLRVNPFIIDIYVFVTEFKFISGIIGLLELDFHETLIVNNTMCFPWVVHGVNYTLYLHICKKDKDITSWKQATHRVSTLIAGSFDRAFLSRDFSSVLRYNQPTLNGREMPGITNFGNPNSLLLSSWNVVCKNKDMINNLFNSMS